MRNATPAKKRDHAREPDQEEDELPSKLLTMADCARHLGVPVDELPRLSGFRARVIDLSGRKAEGRTRHLWRIRARDLEAWLDELRVGQGAAA